MIAPGGREVRPTSGKTRQAVFNMIRGIVQDADVIDFFAGSGALGIEALSNGAAKALFVDDKTCPIIKKALRDFVWVNYSTENT